MELHERRVDIQRHEPETLRHDFVVYDASIVPHVDVLDGDGWYFCNQNTAESIGDGGVDADEVELDAALREPLYFDFEVL